MSAITSEFHYLKVSFQYLSDKVDVLGVDLALQAYKPDHNTC